jgi:hypothetical protein
MRWAGNAARMVRGDVYIRFYCRNPTERGHLEDPGVDGRMILKYFFKKCDG